MLSNGDVSLASKEGAAAEGPQRGGLEDEEGRGLPQAAPQLEQRHSSSPGKGLCQDREKGKEGGVARKGWEGLTTAHLHPYTPLCHGEKGGEVCFLSFSPFKPILIDNMCNFHHYVSGLPVTVMGH